MNQKKKYTRGTTGRTRMNCSVAYQRTSTAPALVRPVPFTLIEGGKNNARIQREQMRQKRKAHAAYVSQQFAMALFLGVLVLSFFVVSHIAYKLDTARINAAIQNVELEQMVVMPGDNLWSIASHHGIENLSTQETIRFINEQNKLDSTQPLMAGQRLLVPSNHNEP
ncbi:MAG: LysM peptidoglycan-binding domain-containing protein [Atopobiaceae bacterium]|nr:LysM peptidoglycan-binding domain-containing protein [Atopobiaceae bacterium]